MAYITRLSLDFGVIASRIGLLLCVLVFPICCWIRLRKSISVMQIDEEACMRLNVNAVFPSNDSPCVTMQGVLTHMSLWGF